MKPPKQAYVKKDEAVRIQKLEERDLNYLNENYYYYYY
jgi:hypothetical protein